MGQGGNQIWGQTTVAATNTITYCLRSASRHPVSEAGEHSMTAKQFLPLDVKTKYKNTKRIKLIRTEQEF